MFYLRSGRIVWCEFNLLIRLRSCVIEVRVSWKLLCSLLVCHSENYTSKDCMRREGLRASSLSTVQGSVLGPTVGFFSCGELFHGKQGQDISVFHCYIQCIFWGDLCTLLTAAQEGPSNCVRAPQVPDQTRLSLLKCYHGGLFEDWDGNFMYIKKKLSKNDSANLR